MQQRPQIRACLRIIGFEVQCLSKAGLGLIEAALGAMDLAEIVEESRVERVQADRLLERLQGPLRITEPKDNQPVQMQGMRILRIGSQRLLTELFCFAQLTRLIPFCGGLKSPEGLKPPAAGVSCGLGHLLGKNQREFPHEVLGVAQTYQFVLEDLRQTCFLQQPHVVIAAIALYLGKEVLKRSREGCFEFGIGRALGVQRAQGYARAQFFRHFSGEVIEFLIAKKSQNQEESPLTRHANSESTPCQQSVQSEFGLASVFKSFL